MPIFLKAAPFRSAMSGILRRGRFDVLESSFHLVLLRSTRISVAAETSDHITPLIPLNLVTATCAAYLNSFPNLNNCKQLPETTKAFQHHDLGDCLNVLVARKEFPSSFPRSLEL